MSYEEKDLNSPFLMEDDTEEEIKGAESSTVEESEEAEQEVTSAPENPELDKEKQWYVANTYSGRESIVADYLEKRKISMHLENEIFRIVVPEKEVQAVDKNGQPKFKKDGTPIMKKENEYPGYIFVEAIMTDQAWYVIRNTPGVTGIVGSSGSGTKPFPIPREDMMPILKMMNLVVPEVRTDYKVGERVHVIEGSFADEYGEIISIDPINGLATVSITFFGRPTSVSFSFSQLEKAD